MLSELPRNSETLTIITQERRAEPVIRVFDYLRVYGCAYRNTRQLSGESCRTTESRWILHMYGIILTAQDNA